MLNMLRFKSSLLFGIHTLLDKSLRVLQAPAHLSNLTAANADDQQKLEQKNCLI